MSIALIHTESDALTISWPRVEDAKRYVLQYRNTSDEQFQVLSDKLAATQARKKNLTDDAGMGFIFRVGAVRSDEEEPASWATHDEPFKLLSKDEETSRMQSPSVSLGGTNHAALVSWKASKDNTGGYEIQMRENAGGAEWMTIAPSFAGLEVRKKNLLSEDGYQFRVRPAQSEGPFSPPSSVIASLGLSVGMKRLFGSLQHGTLLKGSEKMSLEDALGGKEFVLLYASASWCGPCRSFTPQLANWYKSLPANGPAEIVFLSADHDDNSFNGYYRQMPWLAVNFDEDTPEQLMAHIRVTGIPRLAVLDGRTGQIVEDNAVGKPLDVNRWRMLANKANPSS